MSENTQNPNFKQNCAQLWKAVAPFSSIDRFHEKISVGQKAILLGFADITIGCGTLFSMKVRGVEVKLLNGKPHLNFLQEKGADGKYYPMVFPKTGELREVLTTFIFGHDAVTAAMHNAVAATNDTAPAQAESVEIPVVDIPGVSTAGTEIPASVAPAAPAPSQAVSNPFIDA